jgi:predicted nucleic acid-binding protein
MPGRALFLDSSYVIALAQPGDAHPDQAVALAASVQHDSVPLVTTQAVSLEIGAALAKAKVRQAAVQLIDSLASPHKWKPSH